MYWCRPSPVYLKAIKIWVFKFMICVFLGGSLGLYLFNCLIFTLCHSIICTVPVYDVFFFF